MFRQVHRRLTLLCAGITILVLIFMACSYLYISEKNLKENSFASFRNDMNTLLSNLENQTVITHEWLSKLEGGGKYIISIHDNDKDFLWGQQDGGGSRKAALEAGWAYYQENAETFPTPLAFTITHQEFRFFSAGQGQDDYFGCIALSSRNTGKLTILILESLAPLQEQIKAQRHTFFMLVAFSSLVLILFAYFFTGRLLIPLQKSRDSQIQFVAAASHELRTPLSVILSAASACQKASPDEQESFFHTIENEGAAMSRLISDLLMLAGADSHSFPLRPGECEPDTLLLNTFEAFEPLAHEKGFRLSVRLPEEKTAPIRCDSERIRQVLSIFLHNAFSFCPKGSEYYAFHEAAGKAYLLLCHGQRPRNPRRRKTSSVRPFLPFRHLPPKRGAFRTGAFHRQRNHGCPPRRHFRFRHAGRRHHLYNYSQIPRRR